MKVFVIKEIVLVERSAVVYGVVLPVIAVYELCIQARTIGRELLEHGSTSSATFAISRL
jgi:hypothetical protein